MSNDHHGANGADIRSRQQAAGRSTLAVITLSVGAFALLTVLDLLHLVGWRRGLSIFGVSFAGIVSRLWVFQFITAPFVHASLTHLAFNMLTLRMLGPDVEGALGRRRYVLFSFICAESSMLGFLLWNWGTPTIGMGYSGVIFGILAAQALLFPDRVLWIYAFFPVKMRYAALILGGVELYFLLAPGPGGVGHIAHLCGGGAGWVCLKVWQVRGGLPGLGIGLPGSRPVMAGREPDGRSEIPREL